MVLSKSIISLIMSVCSPSNSFYNEEAALTCFDKIINCSTDLKSEENVKNCIKKLKDNESYEQFINRIRNVKN